MEPTIPETDQPQATGERSSTGLEANVAGLLCYVLGVITGIVFLVIERQSTFVRFHAVQSTVTFGAILVIQLFSGFIPLVGNAVVFVLGPLSFVLWILLMVKAFQGERFKLPVMGDIAEQHSNVD
jgi:uncharacterized membrane protein